MGRHKLLGLLLLTTLTLAGVAYAQESDGTATDDDVNRVARELYCPICENTPLDVCETQACEDWRELIREKLEAGQSDQEIVTYFAEIYGERARATPTTEGFSLVVWVLPVIGVVVGAIYLAQVLRRWLVRGTTAESPAPPSPILDAQTNEPEVDDYVARLEREIRESS